ncbi:MAG: Lipopolysaccharide export system ATP-binding protein LptB [Elusimicrobia bacterium ADurb.Bin231]|nr:MAG: Lipopolysaccharide export system ATP-binding protein LptB [Elusimicrobia bacterium ADurb.Bin231]
MKIRVENIIKNYGKRRVVNGITLNINEGEILGLLGPNGAGKTTSFHIIVGLIKADSGHIYCGDEDIIDYPVHARAQKGIVYLSQEPSVFRGLTVEDNILAVLEMLNYSEKERKRRAEDLMKQFNVFHLRDRYSHSLSGGERRRTEIARALTVSPRFILLDEPFVGIDPITINDIQTIIRTLKNNGIGIILTDHNVREALEIIDRAYIIYDGKILMEGSAKELIDSAEARKIYLGEEFKM